MVAHVNFRTQTFLFIHLYPCLLPYFCKVGTAQKSVSFLFIYLCPCPFHYLSKVVTSQISVSFLFIHLRPYSLPYSCKAGTTQKPASFMFIHLRLFQCLIWLKLEPHGNRHRFWSFNQPCPCLFPYLFEVGTSRESVAFILSSIPVLAHYLIV